MANIMRRTKTTRAFDKHKGPRAEIIACHFLMTKGYEVLRNVSPFGPVDLVALKLRDDNTFEVRLIDVKSASLVKRRSGHKISRPKSRLHPEIEELLVVNEQVMEDPSPFWSTPRGQK